MRLVVARCVVDYVGRLSSHLPDAVRLIMVKSDGCVAVHSDGGAYKPLNWMNAPNFFKDEGHAWTITNTKGELLQISFTEVISDETYEIGSDPGLQKDGVEAHLQELLAGAPEALGEGFKLIRREHQTEIGPVDLLCTDAEGQTVAVEVKRRGEMDGVEQLSRYLEFLQRDQMLAPVRGMLVAQEFKQQAKTLAQRRNIEWRVVDYDDLRGMEQAQSRLF